MSMSAVPASSSFQQPVTLLPSAQLPAAQTQGSYGLGGASGGNSGGSCCDTRGLPAPLSGSNQENVMRGDLTGDLCVAIDLFSSSSHGLCSAIWREKTNESMLLTGAKATSVNHAIVSTTAKGEGLLKEHTTGDNTAKLGSLLNKAKSDIVVGGKQDSKQYTNHYPTQQLHSHTGTKNDVMGLTLSLLIDHSAKVAIESIPSKVLEDLETKPTKKAKKAKKAPRKPLTFVVPCSFDQIRLNALLVAAKQIESTQHVSIKNFFNRGVSAVAGALYRSAVAKNTSSGSSLSESADLKVKLDSNLPESASPIVYFFNVSNISETVPKGGGAARYYYDACLIQCEEGKRAADIGNLLGYERLSTLATTCGLTSEEGIAGEIKSALQLLLQSSTPVENSHVTVLILDGKAGSSFTSDKLQQSVQAELSGGSSITSCGAPRVQLFKAYGKDAAIGASLLSAAELDSSKQYMLQDEGWKIGYQLPVADGVLQGTDIAVQVVDFSKDADADPAVAEEDCLFKANSRLWKTDVGNITREVPTLPSFQQTFKWGSAYFPSKNKVGWPKVLVSQRVNGGKWTRISTITPLQGASESEKEPEAVANCELSIEADHHTGLVVITSTQGPSLKEVRKSHFWVMQLLIFLLLPFIVYALYKLISRGLTEYDLYTHRVWLTDFYQNNAPEKLQDPTYVAKTIKKYEGRMFLLWRKLQTTYDIKWSPPTSIVDTVEL